MITLQGKSVCKGIVVGDILFIRNNTQQAISTEVITDIEQEIVRFEKAKAEAGKQLEKLYQCALEQVGEEEAQIFDVHKMMLEDEDFCDSVKEKITDEQIYSEYAVDLTAEVFASMFAEMDDAYMKARAIDIKDISHRIIRILKGEAEEDYLKGDRPVIVAAVDLTPSETIQMDHSKLLGFITVEGSTQSHTAILARTIDRPAIVDIGEALSEEVDGQKAIIDGYTGRVYINPDKETLAHYEELKAEEEKKKQDLKALKGKETKTLDGKKIKLFANIGSLDDVKYVIENDAEGIGLLRSEFIYLQSQDYPTEEEQFVIYKQIAEAMVGKTVIIRTLDIGADKKIDYFNLPIEENPAMGYRAIRICLTEPHILITQLRAILRASAYGNIALMFPMIISLEEVEQVKAYIEEVKKQLTIEEIAFDNTMQIGIMIETPAAVMIADELAKEVDFFSIGTNDLTQYTLAIDRQNQKLDKFYHAQHKAILRMIKIVTDAAHKENKWVGICGELGADTSLTELFLGMGIDEISVAPSCILPIRRIINQTCREKAGELLKDRL